MKLPTRRVINSGSEPSRDRPFNAWRTPLSVKAKELVAEAVGRIEAYEAHRRPRGRRRKLRDRIAFEATVSALVCDLAHHYLSRGEGGIAITRNKRELSGNSRYRPLVLNKRLPHIIDCMASPELGLVLLKLGSRPEGRQTTIKTGPILDRWIGRARLTFGDLGRDDSEEVILLKGRKPVRGQDVPFYIEPKAPLVAYIDDNTTRRLRAELRSINAWLAKADLSLLEACPGEFSHIDTSERRLRRHFAQCSFERGGRLFGAFWLTLRKDLRQDRLRINGEPIVTLDYRSMFVSLAYARVGADPPPGDPYTIPGVDVPRKAIKRLMTASFFRDGPITRAPRGTREDLPKGVSVGDIMAKIADHHRPIEPLLGSQIGYSLMHDESEILLSVLSRLRALGIVALPLHDAIVTTAPCAMQTRAMMIDEYRKRTGRATSVEEE